jgi:O-antigen/teichoic acid export membrane protein
MEEQIVNPVVASSTPSKIIRNTLFSIAGNWFLLLLNFILIPFIIRKLGVELYGGAWIIGAIVLSFIGLIDFGIGSACTKYIAEYYSKHDFRAINTVVSTGITFSFIISGTLAGVSFLMGTEVITMLGVPQNIHSEAYFVFTTAMLILVLVNTATPISVIMIALQRMDISNIVVVATSILNFSMSLIVLHLGWGAKGLILGNFAVQLFSVSWMIWWAKKLFPQLHPRLINVDRRVMKQLFHFGGNLQLSRLAQLLVSPFDKIVALRFFGPSASAFYEITVKMSSLARSIPLVLASALLPAASELDANKETTKITLLFERGSKYMIILGLLVTGFIFTETRLILSTWLGDTIDKHGIETITLLVRILLIGYFINISTGAASSIAAGIGKTNLERKMGIVLFIASPTLLLVLPKITGFYGIPTAITISLCIGSGYYMYLFCSSINRQVSHFWLLFVKPMSSLMIAIILEQVFHKTCFQVNVTSRVDGGVVLVALFSIYIISYSISLKYLGAFDEYDINLAKALINKYSKKDAVI